jgi:hypothetical protein
MSAPQVTFDCGSPRKAPAGMAERALSLIV